MKFDNYISLGSACPLASSMSKYGLRSFSGVFDWLITNDFEKVLYYIENDFLGFLEKENLESHNNIPKKFYDKSNGFIFIHEHLDYIEEYEQLKNKYNKKIERFLFEISKNTCFLRSVSSDEELNYIIANSDYINSVIKKNNTNNEIVFLIKNGIKIKDIPFRYFQIKGIWSGASRRLLRSWLDDSNEFLTYCAKNCSSLKLMDNLIFDNMNENKHVDVPAIRYDLLLKLMNMDSEKIILPDKIIIYGAGNIGIAFYKKIKGKCKVVSFVDKNKYGAMIDEILICKPEDIYLDKDIPFVVTATYDFNNIYNEIKSINKDAQIVSLEEIINNSL